jgi:hypothetical protein
VGATLRHELTPLTSLTFDVGRQQERFEVSPLRDADSTQINAGLRFDEFALVSGVAQIGFRDYKPLSSDVPGYRGATSSVNLEYVAFGSSRLNVLVGRDVQQSFDIDQPYYLQTGFSGSITQQIYGPLDVEGRGGRQWLAYRDRLGAIGVIVDREDRVQSYGGGIGYRLGEDLRIGFNVDHLERESEVALRRFEGLKYGMSMTYGR